MRIALISSEMEPYAKTGGLGDVTSALSRRLARHGHELKAFLPKYKHVYQTGIHTTPGDSFTVPLAGNQYSGRWETYTEKISGVEVHFIVNDDLYMRDEIYVDKKTGLDYPDSDLRFAFLCAALFEVLKKLDWCPEIIHANDWQTAACPALLSTTYAKDDLFADTRCVLTIHNAAYQGSFSGKSAQLLGINPSDTAMLEKVTRDGKLNFLKAGVTFADLITAVSERYAVEIQSSAEFGAGLEDTFRSRNNDLHGVINGVDYTIWDPSADDLIAEQYDSDSVEKKAKNKTELQKKVGLPHESKHPIIGMVTRLAAQKGIELFIEIADDILGLDVQMVVLGDGDSKYVSALEKIQKQYPNKFKAIIGFDNKLAHMIEAGADMYLMPSRYEPCGLNQMYSLRYGTPPIVRETGGLADTISETDPAKNTGNGFVFKNFSSDELLEAMCRALDLYRERDKWIALMKRGMKQDYSWDKSASRYEELYELARKSPARAEKQVA